MIDGALWAVAGAGHGAAEAGGGTGLPEVPNLVTLLFQTWHGHPVVDALERWQNPVFAGSIIVLVTVTARWMTARLAMVPGRRQSLVEGFVEMVDGVVASIIGHEGRRYTPLIGTLFLYILVMNVAGMVPLLKSPTSSLNTTLGLALCVFLYVQHTGIRQLGLAGYLKHLMGEPLWLAPITLPIHIVGELAKPVSLALRLFGNITGEDALLGVMLGLGVAVAGLVHSPIGVPLHTVFYPLVALFSLIQALIFSVLSAVYILLMLPHEEHHEAAGH